VTPPDGASRISKIQRRTGFKPVLQAQPPGGRTGFKPVLQAQPPDGRTGLKPVLQEQPPDGRTGFKPVLQEQPPARASRISKIHGLHQERLEIITYLFPSRAGGLGSLRCLCDLDGGWGRPASSGQCKSAWLPMANRLSPTTLTSSFRPFQMTVPSLPSQKRIPGAYSRPEKW
jgi:hypothetical protein